ncbi:MAG: DnaJ family molecular chaperone [Rhizobiaceae bacterium]|nr:DnaJ family molecular chaperone [Rhizobiaceae bacterium]
MSIWTNIGALASRMPVPSLTAMVETLRSYFGVDPELRRQVAFSVAMIALSAKMAKADGVVTDAEVGAFRQIFQIPADEERNVARLYNLARQDVAGFESYAQQMANLCGSGGPNCMMLEDILDGLFHIAKSDGLIHEHELGYLRRVAEIFEIEESHFEQILARHAVGGEGNPFRVLGVSPDASRDEVTSRYRQLAAENHPDRLMGRGFPAEFIRIANDRMAAINAAYAAIEASWRFV